MTVLKVIKTVHFMQPLWIYQFICDTEYNGHTLF